MVNAREFESAEGRRPDCTVSSPRVIQDAQVAMDADGGYGPKATDYPEARSAAATTGPMTEYDTPAAEKLAEQAVSLATDGPTVVLTARAVPSVALGPFTDPAAAERMLWAVRRFVAALILSAYPGSGLLPRGATADGEYPVI